MPIVSGIDILFATGNQHTGLVMRREPGGGFDATFAYRRKEIQGFPRCEAVNRKGTIPDGEVESLLVRVLEATREWYHHYRHSDDFQIQGTPSGRWSLRVDYEDGGAFRCDGVNAAPRSIDNLYGLLVDLGMPALKLSQGCLVDLFGPWHWRNPYDSIICYEALLEQALSLQYERELNWQVKTLLSEFEQDIDRYLPTDYMAPLDVQTDKGDDAARSVEELMAVDVSKASRFELISLIESLSQLTDLQEGLRQILDSGTFARWCARIKEIPSDERHAYYERQEEENRILAKRIDRALGMRIANKTEFTSHDVAKDLGTTAQKVSSCVRKLVREGLLEAIAGSQPRRYRAVCPTEDQVPV